VEAGPGSLPRIRFGPLLARSAEWPYSQRKFDCSVTWLEE